MIIILFLCISISLASVAKSSSPILIASDSGNITVALSSAPPGSDSTCDFLMDDCAGGPLTTTIASGTSCTSYVVTSGLAIDANCRFRARGKNGGTLGELSDVVTYFSAGVPSWDTNGTRIINVVKSGDDCVLLSWLKPAEHGSPITCYGVKHDTGNSGTFVEDLSCDNNPYVTSFVYCGFASVGLSVRFRFRVYARNRVGSSESAFINEVAFSYSEKTAPISSTVTNPGTFAWVSGTTHSITIQSVNPSTSVSETTSLNRKFIGLITNNGAFDETNTYFIQSHLEYPMNSSNWEYVVGHSVDNSDGTYTLSLTPNIATNSSTNVSVSILAAAQGGFYAMKFTNQWFYASGGSPTETSVEPVIDFNWGLSTSIVSSAVDFVSIKYIGYILAPYSEWFTFYVDVDDNAQLWINDKLIINAWNVCCGEYTSLPVWLNANEMYYVRLIYREITGEARLRLSWSSWSLIKQIIPRDRIYNAYPLSTYITSSVSVTPGDAVALNCEVLVSNGVFDQTHVAGDLSFFYVIARDSFNNTITPTNNTVYFTAQINSISYTSYAYNASVFRIDFVPTVAGRHLVRVLLNNTTPIYKGNFDLEWIVAPGLAHSNSSNISFTNSGSYVAGFNAKFLLDVRDDYNNTIASGNSAKVFSSVSYQFTGFTSFSSFGIEDDLAHRTSLWGTEYKPTDISYVGDGQYEIDYTLVREGSYSVLTRLVDNITDLSTSSSSKYLVPNSPHVVNVVSGTMCSSDWSIVQRFNYGLSQTQVSGQSFFVGVVCRDSYGNFIPNSRVSGSNSILFNVGPYPFDYSTNQQCSLVSGASSAGSYYVCQVTPKFANTSRSLFIYVNGGHGRSQGLTGANYTMSIESPFNFTVIPSGFISNASFTINTEYSNYLTQQIDSTYVLPAGISTPILVSLTDVHGNQIVNLTNSVHTDLSLNFSICDADLTVTKNTNGTYTVDLYCPSTRISRPGLTVWINSTIVQHPYLFKVIPGPVNKTNCSNIPTQLSYEIPSYSFSCLLTDYLDNSVNDSSLIAIAEFGQSSTDLQNILADVLRINGSFDRGSGFMNFTLKTADLPRAGEVYTVNILFGVPGGLFGQYFINPNFGGLLNYFSEKRHLVSPTEFAYTVKENWPINYYWRINSSSDIIDPIEVRTTRGSLFSDTILDHWSAKWSGWLLPKWTGTHTLSIQSNAGVKLVIGNVIVVDTLDSATQLDAGSTVVSPTFSSGNFYLETGKVWNIEIFYQRASGFGFCRLLWASAGFETEIIPKENLLGISNGYRETYFTTNFALGSSSHLFSKVISGNTQFFIAGDTSFAIVQTYDFTGRLRQTSDDNFAHRYRSFFLRNNMDVSNNTIIDDGEGRIRIDFSPTVADDSVKVFIQILDFQTGSFENINGSPFSAIVVANAPDPSKTQFTGTVDRSTIVAGERNCFKSSFYDQYNNPVWDEHVFVPKIVISSVTYYATKSVPIGSYEFCWYINSTTPSVFASFDISIGGSSWSWTFNVVGGHLNGQTVTDGLLDWSSGTILPGTPLHGTRYLKANETYNYTLYSRDPFNNFVKLDNPQNNNLLLADGLLSAIPICVENSTNLPLKPFPVIFNGTENTVLNSTELTLQLKFNKSGAAQLDCGVAFQNGLNINYYANTKQTGTNFVESVTDSTCLSFGPNSTILNLGSSIIYPSSLIMSGWLRPPMGTSSANCDFKFEIDDVVGSSGHVFLNGQRISSLNIINSSSPYTDTFTSVDIGGMEDTTHLYISYKFGGFISSLSTASSSLVCLKWKCPSSTVSDYIDIPKEHLYNSYRKLKYFPQTNITVFQPPPPISSLVRISPISATDIGLKWTPPGLIQSYFPISYYEVKRRILTIATGIRSSWTILTNVSANSINLDFTDSSPVLTRDGTEWFEYSVFPKIYVNNIVYSGSEVLILIAPCEYTNVPPLSLYPFSTTSSGSVKFTLDFGAINNQVTSCTTTPLTILKHSVYYGTTPDVLNKVASSTLNSITITGLSSGVRYYFKSSVTTWIGESAKSSSTISFQCCEVGIPSTPTSGVIRDLTRTNDISTVSFNWTVNNLASFYRIWVDSVNVVNTSTGDVNYYVLSGRGAGVGSFIQYSIIGIRGESGKSPGVTLYAYDAPDTPLSPVVISSDSNHIQFAWSLPATVTTSRPASGYKVVLNDSIVVYENNNSPATRAINITTSGDERHPVSNDSYVYRFKVYTINDAGVSSASDEVFAYAATRPSPPQLAPYSVANRTNDTAIHLRFGIVSDNGGRPIETYVIQRRLSTATAYSTVHIISTNISTEYDAVNKFYTFEDGSVTTGSIYVYRIYATNGITTGDINYSPTVEILASVVNDSPNVYVIDSGDGYALIEWIPPANDPVILSYNVYLGETNVFSTSGLIGSSKIATLSATSTSARISYNYTKCLTGTSLALRVTAVSLAGESTPSHCCLSVLCARQPNGPQIAPSVLQVNESVVTLGLLAPVSNIPIRAYRIYRSSTNSTNPEPVGQVSATNVLTYPIKYVDSDPDLTGGTTYYYAYGALNDANLPGSNCNLSSPSTLPCAVDLSPVISVKLCDIPSAPTSVSRSSPRSDGSVSISWSAVSTTYCSGVIGYIGYLVDSISSEVTTTTKIFDGTGTPNVLNFNISSNLLTVLNGEYTVQVYSVNFNGKISLLPAELIIVNIQLLSPPTNVYYLANQIHWTPPNNSFNTPLLSYFVYHDNGGASSTLDTIVEVCTNSWSYTPSTDAIRVKIVPNGICSYLNQTSATYLAANTCPNYHCVTSGEATAIQTISTVALPINFQINDNKTARTDSSISVVWQVCDGSLTQNCVYSSTPLQFFDAYSDGCNGGPFSKVGRVLPAERSFTFGGLTVGSQCRVFLTANNTGSIGVESNVLILTVTGPPTRPPKSTFHVYSSSMTNITLLFSFNTSEAISGGGVPISHVKIYRLSASQTQYDLVKTLTITELHSANFLWTDSSIAAMGTYYYYYTFMNSQSVESDPSIEILRGIASDVPNPPVSLTVTNKTEKTITLTWASHSYNPGWPVDRYEIYRSNGYGGPVNILAGKTTLGGIKISSGLNTNLFYRFAVKGLNKVGPSNFSDETSAIRLVDKPSEPRNLRVTNSSCSLSTLDITWDPPVSNGGCAITNYQVYIDETAHFSPILNATKTATLSPVNCSVNDAITIFVKATNCDGLQSEKSAILTTPNANPPGLVNWTATPINSTAFNISWTSLNTSSFDLTEGVGHETYVGPTGDPFFLGYRVYADYGNYSDSTVFRLVYNGKNRPNTLYAIVNNLVSGFDYRFYVVGINSVRGESINYLTKQYRLAYKPSVITDWSVTNIQQKCVQIEWTPPSDFGGANTISNYWLRYIKHPFTSNLITDLKLLNLDSSQSRFNYTLCGLAEFNSYQFLIKSVNDVNISSDYSDSITRCIAELPVLPPTDLRFTSFNENGKSIARFDWNYPGGITNYTYNLYVDDVGIVFTGSTGFAKISNVFDCGGQYTVRVGVFNEVGTGPNSSAISVSIAEVPSPPVKLKIISANTTWAYISWSPPLNTGCVDILYYKVTRNCLNYGQQVISSVVTRTDFRDDGVDSVAGPGSVCFYRVSARNTQLTTFSDYSDPLKVVLATQPSAPWEFTIDNSTETSCFISWQITGLNFGGYYTPKSYNVYVDDGLGVNSENQKIVVYGTSVYIPNLVKNRQYRIQVTSVTDYGESAKSNVTTCYSLGRPDPPKLVVEDKGIANSFRITWSDSDYNGGGAVIAYRIYINESLIATINNYTTNHLDVSCLANYSHYITASSANLAGYGPVSPVPIDRPCKSVPPVPTELRLATKNETDDTVNLGVPANVRVNHGATKSSLYLIWRSAFVSITNYTLEMDEDDNIFKVVYVGYQNYVNVTGLSLLKTYRFRLRAANEIGYSNYSSVTSFTVKCPPYAPPFAPSLKSRSWYYIEVEWPRYRGGVVDDCGSSITSLSIYRNGTKVYPNVTTSIAPVDYTPTNGTIRINGDIPIVSAGYAYLPIVTLSTDVLDVEFQQTASIGLAWGYVSDRIIDHSFSNAYNIKKMDYSVGGQNCRFFKKPVYINIKYNIQLTDCDFVSNTTYYFQLYVEGIDNYEDIYSNKLIPDGSLYANHKFVVGKLPIVYPTDLSFRDHQVVAGEYYQYAIRFSNQEGDGHLSAYSSVIPAGRIPDIPAPPVIVHQGNSGGLVEWGYSFNGGLGISYFTLEISKSNGTNFSPVLSSNVLLASLSDLTPNTIYFLRLSVTNIIGSSDYSKQVSFKTCYRPHPPTTNIINANIESDGIIHLKWDTPDLGGCTLDQYNIYLNKSIGFMSTTNSVKIAHPYFVQNTTVDLILQTVTKYRGSSINSTTYKVVTRLPPKSSQIIPSIVWSNSSGIYFSWTSLPTADSYTIWRNDNISEFKQITGKGEVSGVNYLQYTNVGTYSILKGKKYCYKIVGENSASLSTDAHVLKPELAISMSDAVCAYTATAPTLAPSDFVFDHSSLYHIGVSWHAVASDHGGLPIGLYYLEYKLHTAANWTTLSISDRTYYSFSPCNLLSQYNFRVRGKNDIGYGPYLTSGNIRCASLPATPVAPYLPVKGNTTRTSILLYWSPAPNTTEYTRGSDITKYLLYVTGGKYAQKTLIATAFPSTPLSFVHTGLVAGEYYTYYLKYENSIGKSTDFSTGRQYLISDAPSNPRNLVISSSTKDTVIVKFTGSSDNGGISLTSFIILYEIDGSGSFIAVQTIEPSADELSSPDTIYTSNTFSLNIGSTYVIKAIASNGIANSTDSNTVSIYAGSVTNPPSLNLLNSTESSLHLYWSEPDLLDPIPNTKPPIIRYIVLMNGGPVNKFIVVHNLPDTILNVTNLLPGVPYKFKIICENKAGNSSESATYTFTPCNTPPAVDDLVIASRSSTTNYQITISWSAIQTSLCPITSYTILTSQLNHTDYCRNSITGGIDGISGYSIYGTTTSTVTSKAITGDQFRNPYCIVVRANNDLTANTDNLGKIDSHIYTILDTVPSAPTSPPYMTQTNISHTSLGWYIPIGISNSPILNYTVQRRDATTDTLIESVIVGSDMNHTNFTSLTSHTRYSYRFRANNDVSGMLYSYETTLADCCWSDAVKIYASTIPNAPVILTDDIDAGRGTNSFILDWAYNVTIASPYPLPPVLGFYVYQKDDTAGETSFTRIAGPLVNVTQYTVTALSINSVYSFAVTVFNELGESILDGGSQLSFTCCAYPSTPSVSPTVNETSDLSMIVVFSETNTDSRYALQISSNCNFDSGTSTITNIYQNYYVVDCDGIPNLAGNFNEEVLCFRYAHQNPVGISQTYSASTSQRCSSLPDTPTDLRQDGDLNTLTSVRLDWDFPTLTELHGATLEGYLFEYDDGLGGSFSNVVNIGFPSQTYYAATGLTTGNTYRFRYKIKTDVGYSSSYSSIKSVTVGKLPQGPSNIGWQSFTSPVFLTINWTAPSDTGGLPVNYYEIHLTSTHTATDPVPSVIASSNNFYTFNCSNITDSTGANDLINTHVYATVYSINAAGTSSSYAKGRVFCSDLPSAPVLSSDNSLTTSSQIYLTWTSNFTTGLKILSYELYVDGDFKYTISDPSVDYHVYSLVSAGVSYTFQVSVVSEIGTSARSNALAVYACGVPTGIAKPFRGESNSTHNYVNWTTPTSDGGCAVTGYRLFIASIDWSIYPEGPYTSLTDPNDASLGHSFDLAFPVVCNVSDRDASYKLRVYNNKGYTDSDWASIYCAGKPDQMSAVTRDSSVTVTNGTTIALSWSVPAVNGGVMTGFNLFRNNGTGTEVDTVNTEYSCNRETTPAPQTCTVEGLVQGEFYQFQMSAINTIGVSVLSPVATLVAAGIPDAVGIPVNNYSTNSSGGALHYKWTAPNSNGATITQYTFLLYEVSGGGLAQSFSGAVGNPAENFIEITTTNAPSLVTARQYKLCVYAVNVVGTSSSCSNSSTTTTSSTDLNGYTLDQVGLDTVVTRQSYDPVAGTIGLEWGNVSTTGGDDVNNIVYNLYGAKVSETQTSLFEGTYISYNATVPAGEQWAFKVRAKNSRGDYTAFSSDFQAYSCSRPWQVDTIGTSMTASDVTLSWTAPLYLGGTFLTGYEACYDNDCQTKLSTDLSHTWTRPAGTASATFTVFAINNCGNSTTNSTTCDPGLSCSASCC